MKIDHSFFIDKFFEKIKMKLTKTKKRVFKNSLYFNGDGEN